MGGAGLPAAAAAAASALLMLTSTGERELEATVTRRATGGSRVFTNLLALLHSDVLRAATSPTRCNPILVASCQCITSVTVVLYG